MSTLLDVPWAVTPQKVETLVQRLIAAARPRKIILFGSYVRGEVGRDSDLDVVVVTGDDVENPRAESVRLRRCVRDVDMPVDILVVPVSTFNRLRNAPGLIYREACEHGRLAYDQDDSARLA